MLRAVLLALTLLALPACATSAVYPHPLPGRLERVAPATSPDPLLGVVHFGDHVSHTLGVVAGPEVTTVTFVRTGVDDATFGACSSAVGRWHVVAYGRDRKEVVAAVAAREAPERGALSGVVLPGSRLWIGTPNGSGEGTTLAISVDGHLSGNPEARATGAGSQAEALLELRRAQGQAQRAGVARD